MNPNAVAQRDRVGPYALVKAIGAGGSARVDLARIERAYGFQRHVVIKRPLEHLRTDHRAAESLRREARIGARLRHPNLVAILDAGVHDGYDYLVLEYVIGGSLRDLMQTEEGARVRDVPLETALAIVRDVARGVHEAHELRDEHGAPLGLVHRDVSPGNVLVGVDGAVKLADFGIAKETRVATLSGSMHGTVTYMAPEQCRGHAFDRRADIFSLGVILYELVTGARLFWADNDVASLHRVLAGNVQRPRKLKPSISTALEDVIMTAVAHDPERRFRTARELADVLERHGAELGHLLVARSVARWAVDALVARDASFDTATVIDAPLLSEDEELDEFIHSSLVPIIEQTPPPSDAPLATFGPSDAGVVEEAVPPPVAAPAPGRKRAGRERAWLAAVIGGGLAIGVGTAIVATRDGDAPTSAPAETAPGVDQTTPTVEMPAKIETGSAAMAADEPETGSASENDELIEIEEPDPDPRKPPRKKRVRKSKVVKTETKPAETGSGSAPKTTPKVEWDPTMLLPSDKKKK